MRAGFATLACLGIAFLPSPRLSGAPRVLKVYLLAGQSNMEGDGYTHQEGDDWLAKIGYPDATSLEHLVKDAEYRAGLDRSTYSMLEGFSADWLEKLRTDAWAIHLDSETGEPTRVQSSRQSGKAEWNRGEAPLMPGFGRTSNEFSRFGPELGLGHCLGERLDSPLYFFKSDHGGTDLAGAWRPPSAARKRGGETGKHFRNTMRAFRTFLSELDGELASGGGKSARYGGITGYEVAGFVWLQGWNDHLRPEREREYQENLVDLVRDVRAELELPRLPVVVIESADNDPEVNAARREAVRILEEEQPGSAVFVPTGDLKAGYRGGFHFEARAENFLEIGWRAGKAILERGFTGSERQAKSEREPGSEGEAR